MGDILAGIVISDAVAKELVAALDKLGRLAKPTGQQLSEQLIAIRRELVTCVTRVCASGDTSAEVLFAQQVAQYESSVVDTTTAAHQLGITREGVTWLRRNGHLRGDKIGGRWWIETASLHEHRAREGARRRRH